jgi:hypothetical protein
MESVRNERTLDFAHSDLLQFTDKDNVSAPIFVLLLEDGF